VARLRAALKKEEEKTRAVSTWLREQEAVIANRRPAVPPPTPLATTRAARELPSQMSRTLERARRRKDLVERFWQDVLKQGDASGKTPPLSAPKVT
jgi:hypothetical protein